MEIYQVLKSDHEELKQLLNELIDLKEDDEYRYILIEEITNLLVPHSRAEESVFYNTLRAVNADKSLVMHGYKEHLEAETLLRALQVMERVNLNWKPTAMKLKEVLEHHIEDEESDIFDEARSAFSSEEATSMTEAFEKLKIQVQKEGFVKNTMDMMMNMLPPRLSNSIRNFGERNFNH